MGEFTPAAQAKIDREVLLEMFALAIKAERIRAHEKHGPTSMEQASVVPEESWRRACILMEEAGECGTALSDYIHGDITLYQDCDTVGGRTDAHFDELDKELIQTAAMAYTWWANRRGDRLPEPKKVMSDGGGQPEFGFTPNIAYGYENAFIPAEAAVLDVRIPADCAVGTTIKNAGKGLVRLLEGNGPPFLIGGGQYWEKLPEPQAERLPQSEIDRRSRVATALAAFVGYPVAGGIRLLTPSSRQ